MSIQAHRAELERRHQALKQEIYKSQKHPSCDDLKVAELIHASAAAGVPVKELLVREKMLTPEEAESLLGPGALLKLAEPVP